MSQALKEWAFDQPEFPEPEQDWLDNDPEYQKWLSKQIQKDREYQMLDEAPF